MWPRTVARRHGLTPDYVAAAIATVVPDASVTGSDLLTGEPHPAVAALTPGAGAGGRGRGA